VRGRVFAYGTLLTGTPDPALEAWRRRALRRAPRATVPGRLVDLGPYPGLLPPRRRGERVQGRLLALAPGILERLDRYEDHRPAAPARGEYRRLALRARLPSGREVPCWVYLYQGRRRGRPLPGGRWPPRPGRRSSRPILPSPPPKPGMEQARDGTSQGWNQPGMEPASDRIS